MILGILLENEVESLADFPSDGESCDLVNYFREDDNSPVFQAVGESVSNTVLDAVIQNVKRLFILNFGKSFGKFLIINGIFLFPL